jgi:hypothetical protein
MILLRRFSTPAKAQGLMLDLVNFPNYCEGKTSASSQVSNTDWYCPPSAHCNTCSIVAPLLRGPSFDIRIGIQ